MPNIDPAAPCPCESGNPARGCCFFGGKPIARQADTRPPQPVTGYAHPACYAASLNDCSTKISGEHFLSENVLREFSKGTVVVRGFPWQKTPSQRIGIGALAANVLCVRHNSALSPLDVQAGRLFRNLRAVGEALGEKAGSKRVALFGGIDVERWLLKAVMGLGSAGAARTRAGEPIPWSPPALWSQILFGHLTFPRTWGLYVSGRLGDRVNLDAEVSISPLGTGDQLSGCLVTVAGFGLALALRDVPPRRTGALDEESVYRPDELFFVHAPSRTAHSVCFTWTAGRGGGQVQLDWAAPG